MPACIDPDLSYCLIDGHPLFLDLAGDRYFRLPATTEQAFLAHLDGAPLASAAARMLVTRGIAPAAEQASPDATAGAATLDPPSESAMERAPHGPPGGRALRLDVLRDVCTVRLQLKHRTLKDTLAAMVAYRRDRAGPPHAGPSPALLQRLCAAAGAFRNARLYVPAATRCLPDSIALVRYLSRHGLFAHLVFGVMANPLSAHCWVQARHLVVNDTVGNACAHTPIRVV